MKSDYGCKTDKIISHAMFTAKDSYDSQVPHTDYPFKMPSKKEHFYAWTAIIPLTEAGSWLHVWYGTGKGKNVHINYGFGFLFRSDVVHTGGRIQIDDKPGEKYYRLHFYLGTAFQPGNVGVVNYYNHDLRHQLTELYQVPLKKGPQVIKDADEESAELKMEAKKEATIKKRKFEKKRSLL
jgi:hypothetical protein